MSLKKLKSYRTLQTLVRASTDEGIQLVVDNGMYSELMTALESQ